MAISIVDKNYSTRWNSLGEGFLLANAGLKITDVIEIVVDFNFQSSPSNIILITAENQLQLPSGTWETLGVVAGDVWAFTGTVDDGTNTYAFNPVTTYVVQSVSGNLVTFTTSPFPAWSIAQIMPSLTSTILEVVTDRTEPESIEIFHNLVPNSGAGSEFSLFDGEVNRFKVTGVDAMIVTDTLAMTQMGNKSGGSYISCTLERIADVGSLVSYTITTVYYCALTFEDADFNEPSWFTAVESLKPYYKIKALPEDMNPNSALQLVYSDYLGNFGWYDENFNQGVNPYTVDSVTFIDANGNALTTPAYNMATNVTITISGATALEEIAEVNFRLIPELVNVKNKPESNAELTYLANYYIDGVSSATESFGISNREVVMSAQTLNPLGGGETIVITFTMTPTTEFSDYIESLSSESRRFRMDCAVSLGGGNFDSSVSLIISEGLLEKAVTPDQRMRPNFAGFFNHKQLLATGVSQSTYRGCTEDDMVYNALFDLPKTELWQSLNIKIQVMRSSTGETFDIVSQTIPFTPYVMTPDGIIQINYSETIQQFLEADDRNILSLKLSGTSDTTHYECELIWSLMANWRYWIAQSGAFTDFFNASLPNDGYNKEWVRYLQEAGFILRVKCTLTDPNDVTFYWANRIMLEDYDEYLDITTEIEYYDASDVLQTQLIAGETCKIKAIHTLGSGTWDQADVWGWISIRPKEAESNKRISTEWTWTSQNYPLTPNSGETMAVLSFPTTDVAVVECLVDTSMINVNDVTVIGRIESPRDPICESPVDWLFDQIETLAESPEDFLTVMTEILGGAGTDISDLNVCCPTCEAVISGDTVLLYAFGTSADITTLNGTVTGDPCCMDSYGLFADCEVTFDTIFDDLMLVVDGDTTALTALVPTQINSFSSNDLATISDWIIGLTTDETIRYDLIAYLVTNGLKVTCVDGVNTISTL